MDNIMTVTREGYNKMAEELHQLKMFKRQEVIDAIEKAREHGDLSENSEYDEAKAEQGKVESRIAELEELLKVVHVINIDDVKTDVVSIGTRVRVLNITKNVEMTYSLVGFGETDPMAGRISEQSPIGKAIKHTRVGDVISVEVPAGIMELKILSIEKDKG